MSTYPAAVFAPQEDGDTDREARAVRAWRVSRLVRPGLACPVAEAVAGQAGWHDVARLAERGCPAALAVTIVA